MLARLQRPAARDDHIGAGQLGAFELGDLRAREGREPRVAGARDLLDGARAAFGARLVERGGAHGERSEEHTSELQSLMRISYAVFCLKKTTIDNVRKHI